MKSIRISKFSSIKSENIFINILLHIFSAYMIVCSENCSLQVGPSNSKYPYSLAEWLTERIM